MNKDIYLIGIKDLAKKYKKWILIGSLILKISKSKLVNRSILISPKGKIKCYYDKIHMYDAKLSQKKNILSQNYLSLATRLKLLICRGENLVYLYVMI